MQIYIVSQCVYLKENCIIIFWRRHHDYFFLLTVMKIFLGNLCAIDWRKVLLLALYKDIAIEKYEI